MNLSWEGLKGFLDQVCEKMNNVFHPSHSPHIKSEPDSDDFYHSPKLEKSLKRERDDDE